MELVFVITKSYFSGLRTTKRRLHLGSDAIRFSDMGGVPKHTYALSLLRSVKVDRVVDVITVTYLSYPPFTLFYPSIACFSVWLAVSRMVIATATVYAAGRLISVNV